MKYVLVDAISMFRERYAVAVPDSLDDKTAQEWAKDSVTCNDVEEWSQYHIDEVISSTRVLSKEELLAQFDEDNDYLRPWSEDMKMRNVLVLNNEGEKDEEYISTDGC